MYPDLQLVLVIISNVEQGLLTHHGKAMRTAIFPIAQVDQYMQKDLSFDMSPRSDRAPDGMGCCPAERQQNPLQFSGSCKSFLILQEVCTVALQILLSGAYYAGV